MAKAPTNKDTDDKKSGAGKKAEAATSKPAADKKPAKK